jgi:nucleotide-binding universal stress UspA family protein
MFKHLLFATDGSELSRLAIPRVTALAQSLSARLTGLIVSEPFYVFAATPLAIASTDENYRANCETQTEQCLDEVKHAVEAVGVRFDGLDVFAAQPYLTIINSAATQGCDLICMASHGLRAISALVIGSETVKVLTHSKIPFLVLR